jgi:hypothetical protein
VGEVLNQTKNGTSALLWRSIKSTVFAMTSSSMVSVRFLPSGPVSKIDWVPPALALQSRTPRGQSFS